MEGYNSLRETVKKVLENHFKGVEINDLQIREDIDSDGDDILRIKVFFTTESNRLDPKLTSSFVRNLRPEMPEDYADSFPIMSFISNRERGYEDLAA